MVQTQQITRSIIVFFQALIASALAFMPSTSTVTYISRKSALSIPLRYTPNFGIPPASITGVACQATPVGAVSSATASSHTILSVSTLDPTTFLSDTLGGLMGSYAILLVPIVAGLSVVGLIAFYIVTYANPADED